MCGIVGFWGRTGCQAESLQIIDGMSAALSHRGPNDSGAWVAPEDHLALGHRRLAIVDLSPQGHQPMQSPSGRYVMIFNGEIYNFPVLRKRLETRSAVSGWRGHSDTEVLLAAIDCWGLEHAVKQCIGMFACAVWDRREKNLYLVRDRLGEKPLYYGWSGNTFLFASELKALRVHPDWRGEVNRDALALLLRHNYIPAPYSIYRGIHKLRPGTILRLPLGAAPGTYPHAPVAYWSAKAAIEQAHADPFIGTACEATDALEDLLKDAIGRQMVADVPLGAFLSGGVDSSTVVALMQSQSVRPIKTFTIGFCEQAYNEAEHAKRVARHLGTDHTELYVTPQQAMDVIPQLATLYDEPFSDSSQIPTFLVSRLAREAVTVSLSGDAGDELFGGYSRYFLTQSIWKKVGWMPAGLRQILAASIKSLPHRLLEGLFNSSMTPSHLRRARLPDRLYKLADILTFEHPQDLYLQFVSHWKAPTQVVPGAQALPTVMTDPQRWGNLPDLMQEMMYLDLLSYLPDDILAKVDRASMGVGLEARVPFLDHRVVEFAWRLPGHLKIAGGQGKWLLKEVLFRHVPRHLIDRPKMGFGVPINDWLRGPLRAWAEHLLDERRLREEGFLAVAPIRAKWSEHLSGQRNWQAYLWDVLMFEAWLEAQKQ